MTLTTEEIEYLQAAAENADGEIRRARRSSAVLNRLVERGFLRERLCKLAPMAPLVPLLFITDMGRAAVAEHRQQAK